MTTNDQNINLKYQVFHTQKRSIEIATMQNIAVVHIPTSEDTVSKQVLTLFLGIPTETLNRDQVTKEAW